MILTLIRVLGHDSQMATVAERFGMSLERLIDLNADLAHVDLIDAHRDPNDLNKAVLPQLAAQSAPAVRVLALVDL